MKASRFGAIFSLGVSLALVGCGAKPSASPTSPGAPPVGAAPSSSRGPGSQTPATSPSAGSPDSVPYAESAGAYPEGFLPKFRVAPHPGLDGVIRGETPLRVDFDLCGSTPGTGKVLHFLFDWDSNHVADLVGTDTACHQVHTYRVPAKDDAKGEQSLRTNVCVVNGEPSQNSDGTYFSCRTYTIAIPRPTQSNLDCIVTFGGSFTECLDGRVLHEDAGNDGTFESAWYIADDSTDGPGGVCPVNTSYCCDVSVNLGQDDFINFILGHGFKLTDDYCSLPD